MYVYKFDSNLMKKRILGGILMSVQSEFLNFYNRIKLDYSVNSELASKRDILVGILRDSKKGDADIILDYHYADNPSF